jgi:Zn-dependent metalloprotease
MCDHCLKYNRNPIQCIVPPHMLEVLAIRGNKGVSEMAKALLAQNEKTRAERADIRVGEILVQEPSNMSEFVARSLLEGATTATVKRKVYDGENKAGLPGKLVRKEGDPASGDAAVDAAYDGAGDVFDLYYSTYQRDSLDGNGLELIQTVHHRKNYNNAFWEGAQMVYGDGDQTIFKTFTELSVIGHEMSHGVVQFSGGLQYQGQSGALNESYADVMGAMTVQRKAGQDACDADWLVGKGILGDNIKGVALRSMKAPGTAYSDALLGQDPQPFHMDFYVNTTSDNGGVHINSGIPNHAFYLYAQYLGGKAWEKPGQIWYQTLQRINNPMASFAQWATQTVDVAIGLHGAGSWEVIMLKRAWKLVGIAV